jgi:hypothetical protein
MFIFIIVFTSQYIHIFGRYYAQAGGLHTGCVRAMSGGRIPSYQDAVNISLNTVTK